MELRKDAADLRAHSNGKSAGPNGVIELELYDELIAFSALAPHEQLKVTEQASARHRFDEPSGESSYPEIASDADTAFETEKESPSEIIKSCNAEMLDAPTLGDQKTIDFFDELIFETARKEPHDDKPFLLDNPAIESQPVSRPLSNTSPLGDVWSGAKVKTGPIVACQSCGNRSDVGDVFCIACGEFLERAEAGAKITTSCVECEALIGNDDAFCPSCGSMVTAR